MEPASVAMYPSLRELLEAYTHTEVPEHVQKDLRERYDEHGWEYATTAKQGNRVVNACLVRDCLQNAREELVDAVFNLLAANMKGEGRWMQPSSAMAHVLSALEILTMPSEPSGTS